MKASSLAIASVSLAAAIALFSGTARADDYGPHPMLRDLRASAPILLAHFVSNPIVDDAVIEGNAAIVTWQSAKAQGLATFHRRNDRWWIGAVFDRFPGTKQPADALVRRLAVAPAVVARAEAHIPGFDANQLVSHPVGSSECAHCPSVLVDFHDGFETTLTFTAATASWDPTFAVLGRAPTIAEMPPTPHMNAFYFLSLRAAGPQPIVLKGAELAVWFPYVLDTRQKYSLLLGFVTPNIEDIPGELRDNTLRFRLPAFSTVPGKDALGEIDGDFP